MDAYDVNEIFAELEMEVIRSLRRNLLNHMADEKLEGFDWPAWQAMKIRDLQRFRIENKSIFATYERDLGSTIEKIVSDQMAEGAKTVLSEAVKAGAVSGDPGAFFTMPDYKVKALIEEAKSALNVSKTSALRYADDQYRKIIFKSQLYASTGAGTLYKAVDMASKDFLDQGINSIKYADGRQVNIASYSEMVIRTANKKANLKGEGEMRKQLGLDLVLVSQYGASSPTCLPWQGRVYVDDVYSDGNPDDYDGKYPRLSTAIEGGLFHPNCRHRTTTYFEGITQDVERIDEEKALANYNAEQKQRYNERMIRKYKRLSEGSLDGQDAYRYYQKQKQWETIQRDHIDNNPELRRNPWRESVKNVNVKVPESVFIRADDTRIYSGKLSDVPNKPESGFRLGKLNRDKLSGVKLETDEVTITAERIHTHIRKKHPEMLEFSLDDLVDVIRNPDIVNLDRLSKHEIMFVKHRQPHSLCVPVRVITSGELELNPNHTNTVMTFFKKKTKSAIKKYGP